MSDSYLNVKTIGVTITLVCIGVLLYFIFIKKSAPNNECDSGKIKSDLCEKNGCIKQCETGQVYNCKNKDCEQCEAGKVICGNICCEEGNCINGICCPVEFQCINADPTKSSCCSQGKVCDKSSGTCKTTCGNNLICSDSEECVSLYDLPENMISKIISTMSDKSKYEIDGSTLYLCQPRDGGFDPSNEKTSPDTIKGLQPCFNLQSKGFCTSSKTDINAKQACFVNDTETQCNNSSQCVWWDLMQKSASIYSNDPSNLSSLGVEYESASGKSQNGYYCNPENGQGYSRVVVLQGGAQSTYENCVSQLSNHSVRDIYWDNDKKICASLQDCTDKCQDFNTPNCTPNPDVLIDCSSTLSCPNFSDYTCQPDGQLVHKSAPKTYKCSINGTCIEYGLDSWDDKSKTGKYTEATCNNECLPVKTHVDKYAQCNNFGNNGYDCGHKIFYPSECEYGSGANEAYAVCTAFQTDTLTTKYRNTPIQTDLLDLKNYKWSCGPNFDSNGEVVANSNCDPNCGCDGKLIFCNNLLEEDRRHLDPTQDPCYLPS
jgi:hypothetical protein